MGKEILFTFFISFLAAWPAVIEIFHTSVARSKSILKEQITISNSSYGVDVRETLIICSNMHKLDMAVSTHYLAHSLTRAQEQPTT